MDIEQGGKRSSALRLVDHGQPGLLAVTAVLNILNLHVIASCGVIVESCMRHSWVSSAASALWLAAHPRPLWSYRNGPIIAPHKGGVKGVRGAFHAGSQRSQVAVDHLVSTLWTPATSQEECVWPLWVAVEGWIAYNNAAIHE